LAAERMVGKTTGSTEGAASSAATTYEVRLAFRWKKTPAGNSRWIVLDPLFPTHIFSRRNVQGHAGPQPSAFKDWKEYVKDVRAQGVVVKKLWRGATAKRRRAKPTGIFLVDRSSSFFPTGGARR